MHNTMEMNPFILEMKERAREGKGPNGFSQLLSCKAEDLLCIPSTYLLLMQ